MKSLTKKKSLVVGRWSLVVSRWSLVVGRLLTIHVPQIRNFINSYQTEIIYICEINILNS